MLARHHQDYEPFWVGNPNLNLHYCEWHPGWVVDLFGIQLRFCSLVYLLDSFRAKWWYLCCSSATLWEALSSSTFCWCAADRLYFPHTCHGYWDVALECRHFQAMKFLVPPWKTNIKPVNHLFDMGNGSLEDDFPFQIAVCFLFTVFI